MSASDLFTEKKNCPLLGKRILVTRPGAQGEEFALKLRQLGAQVIVMPMIQIEPPDSWEELDVAIASIDNYQWLLFASSNAIFSFLERLKRVKAKSAALDLPNIAVIGSTTANTARGLGLSVNYCPENFLAEDFVANFPGYGNNLKGSRMLWPRTNHGRDFIAKELRAVGVQIDIVSAYKTELPDNASALNIQLNILIADKKIDAITLTSKQTAKNLAKIIRGDKSSNATNQDFISANSLSPIFVEEEQQTSLKNTLQDILIVTIGPETSEGALNYLGKVDREANQHNAEGIINALIEHYKEG